VSTVRIALANLRYPASPNDSVMHALAAVSAAAEEGASVVCFPESYVPGYRAGGKNVPPPDPAFLEEAWDAIAAAARASAITVILGTERIVDGRPRISALVINADGGREGFQDKVQLDPSEESFFAPGTERRLFRAGALVFGIAICHEAWRYPETVRWAARRGAHVVFHPHFHEAERGGYRPASFADPKNTFHEKAMLCRAAENTVYFASVNCASEGSPSTSAVIAPDGMVAAWQPYGKEGLLLAEIDMRAASGRLASRCKTTG
jgi:predicted amidohydrolase